MDSNQSVYRPSADLATLMGASAFELNINLRNTRHIAKSTEILYNGPLVHAPGPIGEAPKIIEVNKIDEAIEKCVKLILELTEKDSLHKHDIVVLCRDKRAREKIQYELNAHNIISMTASQASFDVIRVETVPLFKGLEAAVVIAICDSEWANNAEMSYVSISRARSRFYLIGNVKNTLMQQALQSNYLASSD
jgi:superfamily I DNA and RNA helicase